MSELDPTLILAIGLFAIGLVGAVARRSWFTMIVSIQLLFAAAALAFVAFSARTGDVSGAVAAVAVTVVGVVEAVIALAALLATYRNRASLDPEEARLLRW